MNKQTKLDVWVCYRSRRTSYKWGATNSNQRQLLRLADKRIPVFSSDQLARRFLAGYFRPSIEELATPRYLHRVSWPGNWVMHRHDYSTEQRTLRLTKIYTLDPEPPQVPMERQ